MALITLNLLTILFVIIYLYIVTYVNALYLLPKCLKSISQLTPFQKKICFTAYLIYVIILNLLPLIILPLQHNNVNIDFGVFNESKHLIFLLFITFNLFYNTLIYYGKSRLTKRELFTSVCYIAIIFIISSASVFSATGIYYPVFDTKPDWTPFDTNFANNTYNVTVKVDVETSTYHGFFIDSPLSFVIYGGFVKFNKGDVSKNSTIQLKISFLPHAYNKISNKGIDTLTILNTRHSESSNNTYDIILPKKPWILGYPYSGSKNMSATLLIDGIEIIKVLDKEIVYIEKGHVKAQIDFARLSAIFTIWVIFLAFYPIINRIINWYINTHPSTFLFDDDIIDYIH